MEMLAEAFQRNVKVGPQDSFLGEIGSFLPSVSLYSVSCSSWSAKQPQGAQPGPIPFAGCVFYLLVQCEEVNAAVLGTVCISICLQFLLGLCVPVLGCHRDLPESEVLVISESHSSLLWSFPRTSYHPSPPAVWPSPFVSERKKNTRINMFSRLRENREA